LIIHDSKNRQEVISTFIASPEPLILCSPSLDRGISLEEDLCRLIIVAKTPFLYLGDKIVSARRYYGRIGQDWYLCTAALTILQMCGRGVRSKDDTSDTYILDGQTKDLFLKNPHFLPRWFKESFLYKLPDRLIENKPISDIPDFDDVEEAI
jgi:Rad3-related DNA helicase